MEKIKDFLMEYCKAQGWKVSDNNLIEILRESEEVYKEHRYGSRWWEVWLHVVKIGEKYIGYEWAEVNRDEGIFDLGWEFDWDSVGEYKAKEVTKIVYLPLEE